MTTTLTARLRRHLRVKRYAASGSGEEAAFHKKMIYDTDPGDYTPHSVYMDYLEDAGHGTLAGFLRRSLARQHEAGDAAGSEHAFEGVHYRSPDMGRAYPATYQSLGRVGHLHVAAAKPKRGGIELSVAPAESYTDEAIVNGVPFHYRTRLTANEAHDLADSMDNVSAGGGPSEAGSGPSLGGELRDYLRKRVLFDTRPKQFARRRYASYDVSTPSVSISIPVPGPAAPAPKPKPAPQPAPAAAPAPPAAPVPAPEPTPRAFIFPFAPAPKRRMARGKPHRYAHSDEPAMHAAIAANPAENSTGLAYSDMLEENGKPAHAQLVRNYIERFGRSASVSGRGAVSAMEDPDIPWETAIAAGPVEHLRASDSSSLTNFRVHLFRKTSKGGLIRWLSDEMPREHAADLVRRLHAEAQQSVPPGGEVLLDHHAGNFVNLPARYQRLARGKPRRYSAGDAAGFVHQMSENPAERTNPLVFADYLDDNGHPDIATVIRRDMEGKAPHHNAVFSFSPAEWTGFQVPADAPLGQPHAFTSTIQPHMRGYTDSTVGVGALYRNPRPENGHLFFGASFPVHEAWRMFHRMRDAGVTNADRAIRNLAGRYPDAMLSPPDKQSRHLARRTLTVRPHAEPESVVLLPGRRSLCVPPRPPARKVLLARLRARRRQG